MLKPNDEHCNVEEMLRVRSLILDAPDDEFSMLYYCGTARCIAGWAVAGSEKFSEYDAEYSQTPFKAQRILGLNHEQRLALFSAVEDRLAGDCNPDQNAFKRMAKATREQAAQAIDNVIADGMPHWQDILC